ncbi:hypothetical protein ACFQZE_14525 [Paenibacillus sp. GCM10027627]|uniref:hypothetical protein n=1 Tax=unclassified Paenibacillus TaxID=185978 RepID=UPI003638D088
MKKVWFSTLLSCALLLSVVPISAAAPVANVAPSFPWYTAETKSITGGGQLIVDVTGSTHYSSSFIWWGVEIKNSSGQIVFESNNMLDRYTVPSLPYGTYTVVVLAHAFTTIHTLDTAFLP